MFAYLACAISILRFLMKPTPAGLSSSRKPALNTVVECRFSITSGHFDIGGRIKLFLRAERATVHPSFPNDPAVSTIAGTIVTCDYLGVLARYVVDLAGIQFVVLQPANDSMMRPDDSV